MIHQGVAPISDFASYRMTLTTFKHITLCSLYEALPLLYCSLFCLQHNVLSHGVLVLSRGAPIIGQFADNRYQPFDNRHRPIIGRLFVLVSKTIICLVSKTTKMLLTAVHIDDNEVTNDSVISHVSSSTFNRTK